jgi:hypothetical protein
MFQPKHVTIDNQLVGPLYSFDHAKVVVTRRTHSFAIAEAVSYRADQQKAVFSSAGVALQIRILAYRVNLSLLPAAVYLSRRKSVSTLDNDLLIAQSRPAGFIQPGAPPRCFEVRTGITWVSRKLRWGNCISRAERCKLR